MKKIALMTVIGSVLLSACQPKENTPVDVSTEKPTTKVDSIPLIQAQTTRIELAQKEYCQPATEEEYASCTKFHLQSVKTNVDWINDYFMQRLKQDHAEAFSEAPAVKVTLDPDMPSTNYSTASVRYIAQHYNIAGFEYFSDYFPAGAAHGMHQSEYVIFDLKTKQRLSLNDVLNPASKEGLKTALFEHNADWLEEHHIAFNDFEISDNFYFGSNGIVFVYPLYELASYAEGISELELPYWAAQTFIQNQYLPQLPASSDEIYQ